MSQSIMRGEPCHLSSNSCLQNPVSQRGILWVNGGSRSQIFKSNYEDYEETGLHLAPSFFGRIADEPSYLSLVGGFKPFEKY